MGDGTLRKKLSQFTLDDDDILWWADVAKRAKLIIPCASVLEFLALVYSTYGHPGVGRTTILLREQYV